MAAFRITINTKHREIVSSSCSFKNAVPVSPSRDIVLSQTCIIDEFQPRFTLCHVIPLVVFLDESKSGQGSIALDNQRRHSGDHT